MCPRGSIDSATCCVSALPLLVRVASLAMASLRREVLGGYRRLMRVRMVAFKDDSTMIAASKQQLRIEFNKNKAVTDPSKIGEQHSRARASLDRLYRMNGKCLTIANRGSVTSCTFDVSLSNASCFLYRLVASYRAARAMRQMRSIYLQHNMCTAAAEAYCCTNLL